MFLVLKTKITDIAQRINKLKLQWGTELTGVGADRLWSGDHAPESGPLWKDDIINVAGNRRWPHKIGRSGNICEK